MSTRPTPEAHGLELLQHAVEEAQKAEDEFRSEASRVHEVNEWLASLRKEMGPPPPPEFLQSGKKPADPVV
jgi:hypothetical protein